MNGFEAFEIKQKYSWASYFRYYLSLGGKDGVKEADQKMSTARGFDKYERQEEFNDGMVEKISPMFETFTIKYFQVIPNELEFKIQNYMYMPLTRQAHDRENYIMIFFLTLICPILK